MEGKPSRMLRETLQGLLTLLVLAAVTWGELQVSILSGGSIPILLLFSIAKAAVIIYIFMRISRLWSTH